MKTDTTIYPYNPELANLPFLLKGIGGTRYQHRIKRSSGYNWHQFLLCLNGEGMLEYENRAIRIHENTIIFLPKNKPHSYYPVAPVWEVNFIAFDGPSCDAAFATLGIEGVMTASMNNAPHLLDLFEKMIVSLKTDILYSGCTCSALLYEFIISFHRLMVSDADMQKSRHLSMIIPAIKYMNEHYFEDIPMSDLAETLGITHQHFCRLFRSAMDMSPNEYLTGLRISKAKQMLTEQNIPVSEIATACGFRDPCYFSTIFKKSMGVPPTYFRK